MRQAVLALLLSPILLAGVQSADGALKRYEDRFKKLDKYSIEGSTTLGGKTTYMIRIVMDRKRTAMRFEAIRGQTRFFSAQDGPFVRQIDFETKMYDELVANQIALSDFRLSDVMERTFPLLIARRTLRALAPAGSKFKFIANEKIDGVQTEHIQTRYQVEAGFIIEDLWIDNEGFPRQYVDSLEGRGEYVRYRLNKWKILDKISTTEFQLRIPDGFSPYALQREPNPLEPGQQFPLENWKDARTGSAVSIREFLAKNGGLVLVLGKDAISKACYKTVAQLKSAGVAVMVVEASAGSGYDGACANGVPGLINKIAPGDLPFGFILDAKGVNKVMVQGFDREAPRKFVDNVLALMKQKA